MIEDAQRIFDYLPVEYKTQIESGYVDFLWDAFTTTYENQKYQFAYIAYHMLFMCFVYFQLTKIYLNIPEDIKKVLIFTGKAQSAVDNYEQKLKEAEAKKQTASHFDPFSLSGENERTIVGLFVSIGCDRNTIKRLRDLVDERNSVAHSNGNINFSVQSSLDEKIDEIIDCIDHIHQNTLSTIIDCVKRFLVESSNPEENEYSLAEDQVREIFIRKNYLSTLDLIQARNFPIEELENEEGYLYILELARSISVLYSLPEYDHVWNLALTAVQCAMESAIWEKSSHSVTLTDVPGESEPKTFKSFAELEECLVDCAKLVFHTNSPHSPEEEFPLAFEANSVVDQVLNGYDEQIADALSDLSNEG